MHSADLRDRNQPSEELWQLVGALADSTLTEAQRDRLEDLLQQAQEARRFCAAYLDLHAQIMWRHREAVGKNSSEPHLPTVPSPGRPTPILGFLGRTTTVLNRPVVWSILAVATIFYGGFTLISWNLRSGSLPYGTDGSGLDVAMVSDSENVRWSDEAHPAEQQSSIQAGKPLRIESGIVELQLKGGASLLIQAPAEWTIDGENQATIVEGKLVAFVPPRAVGFELSTSAGRVIDLGTEFGIDSGQPGTEVHVFKGRVEVEPRAADGAASTSRIKLGAGEAVRLESVLDGRDVLVKKVDGGESKFVRSLAEIRPVKEAHRYADCVRALDPLVYFPVSREEGSTLSDRAQGRFMGRFSRTEGSGNSWESSPFGDALTFRGNKHCDRVTIEPVAGKADAKTLTFSNGNQPGAPFTVALWARCRPGQSTGTLVGKGAGFQEQYLFDILNGKYRFVTISADRKTIGEISSTTPFDGTWQHAAAVFDPDAQSLCLYVNGKQEATTTLKDRTLFATDETTYVGNRPFRGDDKKLTLDGALDEVAIFPRALSASEIDGLYRLQSTTSLPRK